MGADRYRNPDQDLPADFEVNRDAHYAALGLPRDGETFIARVCADMVEALERSTAASRRTRTFAS